MTAGGPRETVRHPPLRILHLVARSQQRGAEVFALELAAGLDALGHENHVVALGAAADGGHERGMPPLVDSTGLRLLDLIQRVRAVRKLLAVSPADVVLAHGGWAAQVAALATPRRGPLLVWQRIGSFSSSVWAPSRRWWWRAITRRFDVAVVLTPELDAELRRLGFRGLVWMIPNSRDPDRFRELDRPMGAARLRAELGVEDQTHLIAFVGHLDRMKRGDRALEVHARVRARGCPAHLLIVGDGPLRRRLEAEARRLDLAGCVTFLGQREDVEWILAGVDLLVVTSDLEGIPGVAIEATMAGCPVVTVPVGGVASVVESGVTGVVMADADVDRMADAVVELLGHADRRAAMTAAGRSRIDRYSMSATAKVYARSLAEAIAERAGTLVRSVRRSGPTDVGAARQGRPSEG